jgi:hypothetical protein
MIKRPNIKKLQAECDKFNQIVPIGGRVLVQLDNHDDSLQTTTRSAAEVLSEHSAVVWLNGVRGCYLLSRVKPVSNAEDK